MIGKLIELNACAEGLRWAEQFSSLDEAGLNCLRTDWLIWFWAKVLPGENLNKCVRMCAQSVLHLWNAPDVVVRYLSTGSKSLREGVRQATNTAADAAIMDMMAMEGRPEAVARAAAKAVYAAANAAADVVDWEAENVAAYAAARAAANAAAYAAAAKASTDEIKSKMESARTRKYAELANMIRSVQPLVPR